MDIGIYLHIPFCRHRCAYCDFNTYAGQDEHISAYVAALCRELEQVAAAAPTTLQAETIFFGGGTPTLLTPQQIECLLNTIAQAYALNPQAEITLEANPETITQTDLQALRHLGVNRLSFGVQSAHPADLRLLERQHDFFTVIRSVAAARRAGFENLNLDLIYGLPGQSLARWQQSLKQVLALQPEHLSLYALGIEHGTPFARWQARGLLPPPATQEEVAAMYARAQEQLALNGYAQYEISNWARPGLACRHNLRYWRGQAYLGFGAGAHGYVPGSRYHNVLSIRAYLQRMAQGGRQPAFPLSAAAASQRRLSRQEEMEEYMMMGLRLTREGVAEAAFRSRFGLTIAQAFPRALRRTLQRGLLTWAEFPDGPHLRLTPAAYLVSNQALVAFISASA